MAKLGARIAQNPQAALLFDKTNPVAASTKKVQHVTSVFHKNIEY